MMCRLLTKGLFNGGIVVKRYLSGILIVASVLIIIIGNMLDRYWSGIAAWGVAIILLIFAAYFTKHIPNDKKKKPKEQ
ncbi:hypothetical protein [Oceanobacillus indicireducens]|uniref:Uncharacterized protein n=1 Tax=Oceanobacillus indicireducens TaxID=1004261 RepID=A0A917XZN9_9BACI|nr:hypothetical protein [Oceanobacillus indicireducens]GGN58742.1 hypothetical protein GCM10007971_21180 [Oceanobacillus indicireducens]